MLEVEDLKGNTFLDVDSGRDCFHCQQRNHIGAGVRSFDYDPQSVACTQESKRKYFREDPNWVIEWGSVLDATLIQKLGKLDIVYSCGVFHHIGNMWGAMENVVLLVKRDGKLYISIIILKANEAFIYNQKSLSQRIWHE